MLTLYFSSYLGEKGEWRWKLRGWKSYFFESFLHDVWSVIDGEDDVCDAGSCESLDLVKDHGPIGEFDQWLGESEGLYGLRMQPRACMVE